MTPRSQSPTKVKKLLDSPYTDYCDIDPMVSEPGTVNLQVEWGDLEVDKDIVQSVLDQDIDYLLEEDKGQVVWAIKKIARLHPENVTCRMVDGREFMNKAIVKIIDSIVFKKVTWDGNPDNNPTNTKKLKECPCCGFDEAWTNDRYPRHQRTQWCVECVECGLRTSWFSTIEAAGKHWNQRRGIA